MKLLKLVIVDDEPILLEGLIKTYKWNEMGFEVVGSARDGEQALEVIREKQPHVVLTDIRMKKMSGLMLMEEAEKEGHSCLFIVLSAYRDFAYAQQACDLGAFAYLLKPVDDEKLKETMEGAYRHCMEQIRNEEKYGNWEKLLSEDSDSLLRVVVEKYVQDQLAEEKVRQVSEIVGEELDQGKIYMAVSVDMDLSYKITNSSDYETARTTILNTLEDYIRERFFYWKIENEDKSCCFMIREQERDPSIRLRGICEKVKEKEPSVIIVISGPYQGIRGMKNCYKEAEETLKNACRSGTQKFLIPDTAKEKENQGPEDGESLVIHAVRKNDAGELKKAFIRFIYELPDEEEQQCQNLHKIMLKTEIMLEKSYGMTEELKEQFRKYYSNMPNLSAAKAVDVCYQILGSAIEKRIKSSSEGERKLKKEYMAEAVAYIEERLNEEQLSIVQVANHVYVNPVYFGRAFKNTFHITFKKYLMKCRMEKAKRLLEEGKTSIGSICDQVGISNPSYFSHLFKEYTGKLPSEYKKEYEG